MKQIRNEFFILIVTTSTILSNFSCKKLVDVDPPVTQPVAASVYGNDGTATAVLTGLYNQMSTNTQLITGLASISSVAAYSADELKPQSATANIINEAYSNQMISTDVPFWTSSYNYIYAVNAAIEGLNASKSLSESAKKQLLGEAKFLRGLFYFYLVNFFGDVPLALSTDYRINAKLSRSPITEVYNQIVSDLKDAQDLLSQQFIGLDLKTSTSERVRPTRWAATALLARVYLYMGDWLNAETTATSVINNSALFSLESDVNKVFLKNSNEAIWQLQPTLSGYNTLDANAFIIKGAPTYNTPGTISTFLLSSFETSDKRRANWIGVDSSTGIAYYFPFKYKINQGASTVSEYLMVLRLAEQYLIRSEARAHLNKLQEAIVDIDMIRQRAGLPLIATTNPGISQSALLDKILHERQVELFTEWGHRWLDLKRTKTADAIMSVVTPQKGGVWNSNDQLYPIPFGTIQLDPNITQNAGY